MDDQGPAVTVDQAWASYAASAGVAAATLRGYADVYTSRIGPALGDRRLDQVTREDVRALVDGVAGAGLSTATVRRCRVVLGAVYRRAVADGLVAASPTTGVAVPHERPPSGAVLTPAEFARVRAALPTAGARLFVDVLAASGARLGEVMVLAPGDVDLVRGALLLHRGLQEPGAAWSLTGDRFRTSPTTKDGGSRAVEVGRRLCEELLAWAAAHDLAPAAALFPAWLVLPPSSGRGLPVPVARPPLTADRLRDLGTWTDAGGRLRQHGTLTSYVAGRCRCDACRQASSEAAVARRRARDLQLALAAATTPEEASRLRAAAAAGASAPPRRPPSSLRDPLRNPTGAIGRHAWARVWAAAVAASGVGHSPTPRELRHAHASWLHDAGVPTAVISARLGHADERSTAAYLRPVRRAQDPVEVLQRLLPDGGR